MFCPLDREFHLCLVKTEYYERMDFLTPFWSEYYFSYLDYDQMQPYVQSLVNSNWTSDRIGVALQNTNQAMVLPALAACQQTAAAQGYAEYIEPSPPTLRITNNGAGSVSLGWSPVALKFIVEQNFNLLGTSWVTISVPPRMVGNDFSTAPTTTNQQQFFRLYQP